MKKLKADDPAPEFSGRDEDGNIITLNSLRGKRVILYFYPKDNTPGCTAEACSLRDGRDELEKMGFKIIGVSPDSEKSHKGFIAKHSLNFSLLADTDHTIATDYGVWGEKKFMGRTYMGILRTTFVIGADGNIEKVVEKVDTKRHLEQIVEMYK